MPGVLTKNPLCSIIYGDLARKRKGTQKKMEKTAIKIIIFLLVVCIISDLIEHQLWKEFSSIQVRTVRGNVRTISNCQMRYSENEMVIIKTKEEVFHMPRINIVYAIEAK